jgi:hypothetical protein
MKGFLLFIIAMLGLLAAAPNESQAQGFRGTLGDGSEYYAPGYYGYRYYNYDPGRVYYYHQRFYYARTYHPGYYYGPDHRYYRWSQ